jgi:hypothetical protein
MKVSRSEIERLLCESIEELFTKDAWLLQNDVSERCLTHKLAEYVQDRIPHLNVDCEYNRNATAGPREPKTLYGLRSSSRQTRVQAVNDDDPTGCSVFPDIIVHRRKTNRDNLLVVEVKKNKRRYGGDLDRRKLVAFTERGEENDYKFKYGAFVVLAIPDAEAKDVRLKYDVEWYTDGTPLPKRANKSPGTD